MQHHNHQHFHNIWLFLCVVLLHSRVCSRFIYVIILLRSLVCLQFICFVGFYPQLTKFVFFNLVAYWFFSALHIDLLVCVRFIVWYYGLHTVFFFFLYFSCTFYRIFKFFLLLVFLLFFSSGFNWIFYRYFVIFILFYFIFTVFSLEFFFACNPFSILLIFSPDFLISKYSSFYKIIYIFK